MKRIKLTHGSARVEDDCPEETIKALDEMVKKAYEQVNTVNQICYKSGKLCKFDCKGLCKESC